MDFSLSEERRMLAETAERFVRDRYDLPRRHANAARDEGFDLEAWREFADLGLIGALLPPEAGGFGGEGEDIMLLFEILGRGLVVEPFLATGVLGAAVLVAAGSKEQQALLGEVIEGRRLLALAHGEPENRYSLTQVRSCAVPEGAGWRLTGQKAVVLNGGSADHFIVSARTDEAEDSEAGISFFLVDATQPGVQRRVYGTVEGGQAAELTFDAIALGDEALIGIRGAAYPVLESVIGRGVLALSAEALGIMEVCKEMTLAYLQTRQQFGRPIGSFQALQHRMVDMTLEIEQVRSAVMLAAGSLNAARNQREMALSAAKNLAGRVGRLVAEESIQMHGGIAMTWDYGLPHFAKRLIMIDHLLGDTDHHLERFAAFSNAVS